MDLGFDGKVAIVTSGSMGTAWALARAGTNAALGFDPRQGAANEMHQSTSAAIVLIKADTTNVVGI